MIKLVMLAESFSGNKYHKRHWSVYAKDKATYLAWCHRMQAIIQHPVPVSEKRHVSFVVYRKRLLDDDNLRSGLKGLRDCFVKVGWLKDDSPKWATFTYEQFTLDKNVQGGQPCIFITIGPNHE